jgi:hypothetical protein
VTGAALVGGIPVLFGSRPAAASHRGHHGWRRFSRLHWRRKKSFQIRLDAAYDELYRPIVPHRTNGDEERYPNRIGNFSKTLPHDECGEVDRDAYRALLHALNTNRFDDFEAVPKGGTGNYLNPMGGTVFSIDGPDTAAIGIEPPPPFASPELAAQAAEVYWMALLRDVPLTAWDSDPLVGEAVDDLARFSGYEGPPLSRQNLFRLDYPGVLDGPMVSQFCWRPFVYDGISVEQKQRTEKPLEGYLTTFEEWLAIQRGESARGFFGRTEDEGHYIFDPRGLGQAAAQDSIYSQYFKAGLIINDLFGFGGGEGNDPGNPYAMAERQLGFSTFGNAHFLEMTALVAKAERHAWYQKWQVHRFLRPEVYCGRVHASLMLGKDYPIHPDLTERSEVLDRIFELNRRINQHRIDSPGFDFFKPSEAVGSYLLPQMLKGGSPTHPSFTAGHAITAGACVTFLKAYFNEDAEIPQSLDGPRHVGRPLARRHDRGPQAG